MLLSENVGNASRQSQAGECPALRVWFGNYSHRHPQQSVHFVSSSSLGIHTHTDTGGVFSQDVDRFTLRLATRAPAIEYHACTIIRQGACDVHRIQGNPTTTSTSSRINNSCSDTRDSNQASHACTCRPVNKSCRHSSSN